jgi:hypothetical protein
MQAIIVRKTEGLSKRPVCIIPIYLSITAKAEMYDLSCPVTTLAGKTVV